MPPLRPSMNDVARAAGVSRNAVSLAFRHDPQIPPATRERILRVAGKLGYKKNAIVSQLMAEMRKSRRTPYTATLALVNANPDRLAFARHPTIPQYVAGCRERAGGLGYGLDEFWLHEPGSDGGTLAAVLRARGIRGVIVVGMMGENRLPDAFRVIWESYPVVVTGVRTRDPALSFACADHRDLARRAVGEVMAQGYRRPGLVIDGTIDALVEGRFSAGFMTAQRDLPRSGRLRPFTSVVRNRERPELFRQWFESARPDVILSLYTEVRDWLARLPGRPSPGLALLEWRPREPEWAGMNQHNDVVGGAAVEMVVAMIQNGESGIPAFPRATLIGSTWMPGASLPPRGA